MSLILTNLQRVAQVVVALPLRSSFSYLIPQELEQKIKVGMRVSVPFGHRKITGYVIRFQEEHTDPKKIKTILDLLDEEALLDARFLELTKWISDYYLCSWGEAIDNALPGLVKRGRKIPASIENPVKEKPSKTQLLLNSEQQQALNAIEKSLHQKQFDEFLIQGITGSGKTEVYIRAIHHTLKLGKSAICLVPEIALTQQIEEWFLAEFGEKLAVFHSRLTDKERFEIWLKVKLGLKQVIVGPRSALFAPVSNLGLLILDEEHDGSYKQQDVPRYHAREVARKRAEQFNAVLLLGSATPSLETKFHFSKKEEKCLKLTQRSTGQALPQVQIVDLKNYATRPSDSLISPLLKTEIEKCLAKKESVLLFLNRRGFSTFLTCPFCGYHFECKRCEVALTYHQEDKTLLCHYCNSRIKKFDTCPKCHSTRLKFGGMGTEKIESVIKQLFPKAKCERMDRDRVQKKGVQEKILSDFRARKIDILVGTQMIAKGFDFPYVTLVGVILADTALSLPDFRASERTFQLLTQVAGRAGRGAKQGKVIVQTLLPEHEAISFSKSQDYEHFYKEEIEKRKQFHYPPLTHLVNLMIRGKKQETVIEYAQTIFDSLTKYITETKNTKNCELIGPAPLPFYRLQGAFRWHILLKGDDLSILNAVITEGLKMLKTKSGIRWAVDVDPFNIL